MQSRYYLGLVVAFGSAVAGNAQFNSAKIIERYWNDFPTSTLVTTNNYPTSVEFNESNSATGNYANQHRWLFSRDNGATASTFGPTDFFSFECDYMVDSNHPEITKRKEGGIIADGISGDGKFMVASDGEIAAFGGPFTFYKFTKTYTPGTFVHIKLKCFKDTFGDNKMEFWVKDAAGEEDSGPMFFSNLENMIPPGSFIGGFAQPQLGGGTLQTADYRWKNIKAYLLFNNKLSGVVKLGDFAGDITQVPVKVDLRTPGTLNVVKTETVNLNADGVYMVDVTGMNGTYDVAIKADHWLRKVVKNVTLDQTGTGGNDVSLSNGDVDGDNTVTVFDYNGLSAAFDSSPGSGNWNPKADLDGDGSVTVFDYNILSSNFDTSGDD